VRMAKLLCICRCHQEARANYENARQLLQWDKAMLLSRSEVLNVVLPVDADDPIEAAVAQGCDCLTHHVIALGGPPDVWGQPWTLENDSQADGDGEDTCD
jgi:hypothetical protein